jgi:hypothetical protein
MDSPTPKKHDTSLSLPEDAKLSIFGEKVFNMLTKYTSFAWPMIKTQCTKMNKDTANLTPNDLQDLIPALVAGVTRWNSAEKGESLKIELEKLISIYL